MRRCSGTCFQASAIVWRHIQNMADRFWTVANAIMLLMFVFSAAVQLNDPDPLPWMGIYGAAAAVCALETRRRTPAWAPVALALVALVWAGSIYYRAHRKHVRCTGWRSSACG
jgi:hypothetical protein